MNNGFKGKIPIRLLKHIQRGSCVLFVGSGISASVARSDGQPLPLWGQLLSELLEYFIEQNDGNAEGADEIREMINRGQFLDAGERLKEKTVGIFGEFMNRVFRDETVVPNDLHRKIISMKYRCILTTNYDHLLEDAFVSVGRPRPRTFVLDGVDNNAYRNQDFFIHKIHGDLNEPESLVLGGDDYTSILWDNPTYTDWLKTIFSSNCVLFVGCGGPDYDVSTITSRLNASYGTGAVEHYYLLPKRRWGFEKRKLMENRGVRLIEYSQENDSDHSQVGCFIDELLSVTGQGDGRQINATRPVVPRHGNTLDVGLVYSSNSDYSKERSVVQSTIANLNDLWKYDESKPFLNIHVFNIKEDAEIARDILLRSRMLIVLDKDIHTYSSINSVFSSLRNVNSATGKKIFQLRAESARNGDSLDETIGLLRGSGLNDVEVLDYLNEDELSRKLREGLESVIQIKSEQEQQSGSTEPRSEPEMIDKELSKIHEIWNSSKSGFKLGRISFIVGTPLSQELEDGVPGSAVLVRRLQDDLVGHGSLPVRELPNTLDYFSSYYAFAKGMSELEFRLRDNLLGSSSIVPSAFSSLAVFCGNYLRYGGDTFYSNVLIVTSNLDLRLEMALADGGLAVLRVTNNVIAEQIHLERFENSGESWTSSDAKDVQTLNFDSKKDLDICDKRMNNFEGVILYKMHGSIDVENSCAVSLDHYYRGCVYGMTPLFVRQKLMNNHTILLGYEMLEPEFFCIVNQLHDEFYRTHNKNFALTQKSVNLPDEIWTGRKAALSSSPKIEALEISPRRFLQEIWKLIEQG